MNLVEWDNLMKDIPQPRPEQFIAKLNFFEDPTVLFQRNVYPFLYTSYLRWKEALILTGGNPVEETFKQSRSAQFIEKISTGIIISHYGIVNPNTHQVTLPNLHEKFPSVVTNFNIPKDTRTLDKVLNMWQFIMQRAYSWEGGIEKSPYIIDLRDGSPDWYITASYLPKTLSIGGFKLLRLMDSFYAPDKQGADWAEKFFDLIADKYEAIVDKELKEQIDLFLLASCGGNVLDIGCGTGLMQLWLNNFWQEETPNVKLFGIDISSNMLKIAEQRKEVVMKGNVALLSPEEIKAGFNISAFNHVLMSYVNNWITHEERLKIFKTAYDLLGPGDSLRFNVYNISQDNWLEYYKEILKELGFKDVKGFKNKFKARDGSRDVGFVFAYK